MKAAGWTLLFFVGFPFFPARAMSSYSYVDLHPPGWIESRATCVNGRGEVTGYGLGESGERGFLWSSGVYTEILPPGADSARAEWVNGRGEVAVTAVIGGRSRAFLYRDGIYIDPTPGWASSEAAYVAEDGAVTGTGEFGAYISRDGVPELLPGFTVVVGANASGQLLGSAENTAVLYLPGTGPGTGYLTLSPQKASRVVAHGLNESGMVAISSIKDGFETGFVYSGGFYVFMIPPGWSSSNARAINNRAQVAGYGDSPSGRRGFLRSGAAYEELSVPGWASTETVSLNDSGQVAGSGETASGETHAFLASPAGSSASADGPGTSAAPGGGGGCSVARAGSALHTPTEFANFLVLFLPLLHRIVPRRAVRRRIAVALRRSGEGPRIS